MILLFASSGGGTSITSAVVADVTGTEITFDATTSGDISDGIFFVNFNFGASADPSAGWQEYVAGAVENQSITVDIAAYGGTVSSIVVAQVGYNPLAPGDPEYSAANDVLFGGLIVPVVVSAAIDNTSPAVGDTLTGEHGIIVGGSPMTITQQWQLCDGAGANCAAIPGETATTYEVVSGDVGDTLKFQQTSTNSAGSDTATSAATAAVAANIQEIDMLFWGIGSNAVNAGATDYSLPGSQTTNATEAIRQLPINRAMTLKNFAVGIRTAQPGTGSLVCTVRKNGAATALTVTFAAGAAASVVIDSVNEVAFAAGDLLSVQLVNNASAGSGAITGWTIETVDA